MLFDHSGFLTLFHPREFIFFSGQQLYAYSISHTPSGSQPATAGRVVFGAREQLCWFQGEGWEVVERKEQLPSGSTGQFREYLVASSCLSDMKKHNQK